MCSRKAVTKASIYDTSISSITTDEPYTELRVLEVPEPKPWSGVGEKLAKTLGCEGATSWYLLSSASRHSWPSIKAWRFFLSAILRCLR